MMNAKTCICNMCLTLVFLVTACSSTTNVPPTIVDVEQSVSTLPPATITSTSAPPTSIAPVESTTPPPATSTNTPLPTPTDVMSLIGTPLPVSSEIIGENNYTQLKQAGQWGRGSILGVGFTPDGKSFIAISEMGWSIYDMNSLDQPPAWVVFDKPVVFNKFYFSSDGAMIRFVGSDYPTDRIYIKSFPDGMAQKRESAKDWITWDEGYSYGQTLAKSPDGSQVFKSYIYANPENIMEEKSVREMYGNNDQLIYSLKDDAPLVAYSDRNGPEGCDISVFSPCGNALMPLATTPVKTLFSNDGKTFTALYEAPDLISGVMRDFSYIRIYKSSNGDLLGSIGGFTKPVQDFDYSPDGKLLVVGFVDGSIVLWDINKNESVLGTRHMNAPAWKVVYSPDSRYLLIQRAGEVEVRLTSNGSLVYRFAAVGFAVSPVQNLVALGDAEGNIQIRDLDTGRGTMNIKAHDDQIYSIAFSPDGLYLASSGQDCNIKLWDLKSGKLLHYFEETAVDAYEIGMSSRIFSTYLEFVPNKNMLIGFGSWGTVVNWNVNSGATNYVIQSDALEYYNGMVTIKPHFPEFFDVNTDDEKFYINENGFNLETGNSLGAHTPLANLPNGCSPAGPVTRDGMIMFTRGYGTREGKICILQTNSLNLAGEIYVTPESDSYIEWVDWLYLSPDGKQLIVTVGSGVIYVYQIV